MKRTLASRSVGRGLVGVEATGRTPSSPLPPRKARPPPTATASNSPFTTALLKHLTQPGLDIRKAFGFVRDDVMSATGNQQEPYTTNSLGGNDVALVPAPADSLAGAGRVNPNAEMRRDYELAERVGTVEAWDSFVAAHPTGFYTDLAKAQRNKLAAETGAPRRRRGPARLPKSRRGSRPKAPRPPNRPRRRRAGEGGRSGAARGRRKEAG